ncbi:MAG: hypothetical protein IJ660_03565 [Alphaproteobacteria bacterium]|nr:hypothetical protein [Alphaproteobacteria bacterium]
MKKIKIIFILLKKMLEFWEKWGIVLIVPCRRDNLFGYTLTEAIASFVENP